MGAYDYLRAGAGYDHNKTRGTWHHVVGVCNETAGYVALYVDGVSNASGTITAASGLLSSANAVSIRLHESLGFVHCGTIRQAGFKFGRWLVLSFYRLVMSTPSNSTDG